jgi:hypothetical protein
MPTAVTRRDSRDASAAPETAHHVDAGVFIGGYRAAADRDFVRSLGVTRIVKMFADDESYPGGYHRHPGVQYFVAGAEDRPGYDIRADAVGGVRAVQAGVAAGERVLVHCHAGISRSATVVLLWLMTRADGRRTLDAALGTLRSVRPFVRPNAGFMRHLRATEARIARMSQV